MPADIPAEAREAHQRAGACIQERRFVDAIAHDEAAARLCPEWAAPWWNLSVGYKHACRWREALDACERAIALDPDDCEGPRWNAGIAATALGQWPRARAAWTSLGIHVPAGEGPIEMELGPTPVRVSPHENPEVVWCARIDPCRARIESIPSPDCGRRYHDLVLHDGEARGRRRLGEVDVPVFDELALIEPSFYGTWEVRVDIERPDALEEMMEALRAGGAGVEDWTANFRLLCEACSLGTPHAHDDEPDDDDAWKSERRLGVAARDEAELRPLRGALFGWRRGVVSVRQLL